MMLRRAARERSLLPVRLLTGERDSTEFFFSSDNQSYYFAVANWKKLFSDMNRLIRWCIIFHSNIRYLNPQIRTPAAIHLTSAFTFIQPRYFSIQIQVTFAGVWSHRPLFSPPYRLL